MRLADRVRRAFEGEMVAREVAQQANVKSVTLDMVVLDVNGNPKSNLPASAYWHRSFVKRLWWEFIGRPQADARIHAHNARQAQEGIVA